MNVKKVTQLTAVVVFVFFLTGTGLFDVRAADDELDLLYGKCPEFENLEKREAQIGGNAWNYYTQWIYNQFTTDTGSEGVKKKKKDSTEGTAGNEIVGWSRPQWPDSHMEDPEHGLVCWGQTCEDLGAGLPPVSTYDTLDRATFIDPHTNSFAELDFDNREPICQEYTLLPDGKRGPPRLVHDAVANRDEPVYKPCAEISNEEERGPNPAYCVYPLKGWMKIRGLGDDGWTRLSGRITGNAVPQEQRDADGKIIDPGTFGIWEHWKRNGQHLNCSDDSVFNANKRACSYRVVYDPNKKEFYGWAWNPLLEWISFSGSTLFDTRAWKNRTWCDGPSCTEVSYNVASKRSRWNTAYLGVWVKGLGGNLFGGKGFSGVNAPPGEFNTDYLLVTGRAVQDEKARQGALDTWEGQCDDPILGDRQQCAAIAAEFKNKREKGEQIPGEEIFDLAFPTRSERDDRAAIKRGSLGTLDTAALFPKKGPDGVNIPTEHVNDYGYTVVPIDEEEDIWTTQNMNANPLNRKIYYYEGDLVIGADDDRVKRILISGQHAAGTVVVKGNLIIKRPLEYERVTPVSNTQAIPSLAWVVLEHEQSGAQSPVETISDTDWKKGGNVVIDSCLPFNETFEARGTGTSETIYDQTFTSVGGVTIYTNEFDAGVVSAILQNQQVATVAGSFFAEHQVVTGHGHGGGDGGSGECANVKIRYQTSTEQTKRDAEGNPLFDENGNEVKELAPERDDQGQPMIREIFYDTPLEIRGIVVARNISFERTYRGVNRGSETVVNSGRLLINPPPGIAEFARSLPLW